MKNHFTLLSACLISSLASQPTLASEGPEFDESVGILSAPVESLSPEQRFDYADQKTRTLLSKILAENGVHTSSFVGRDSSQIDLVRETAHVEAAKRKDVQNVLRGYIFYKDVLNAFSVLKSSKYLLATSDVTNLKFRKSLTEDQSFSPTAPVILTGEDGILTVLTSAKVDVFGHSCTFIAKNIFDSAALEDKEEDIDAFNEFKIACGDSLVFIQEALKGYDPNTYYNPHSTSLVKQFGILNTCTLSFCELLKTDELPGVTFNLNHHYGDFSHYSKKTKIKQAVLSGQIESLEEQLKGDWSPKAKEKLKLKVALLKSELAGQESIPDMGFHLTGLYKERKQMMLDTSALFGSYLDTLKGAVAAGETERFESFKKKYAKFLAPKKEEAK